MYGRTFQKIEMFGFSEEERVVGGQLIDELHRFAARLIRKGEIYEFLEILKSS